MFLGTMWHSEVRKLRRSLRLRGRVLPNSCSAETWFYIIRPKNIETPELLGPDAVLAPHRLHHWLLRQKPEGQATSMYPSSVISQHVLVMSFWHLLILYCILLSLWHSRSRDEGHSGTCACAPLEMSANTVAGCWITKGFSGRWSATQMHVLVLLEASTRTTLKLRRFWPWRSVQAQFCNTWMFQHFLK